MESIIFIFHILLAIGIICLVLLQRGKGAEAGASFGGGASQTVFGSQGSGSFLTRLTAIFALLFIITSISLTKLAFNKTDSTNVINVEQHSVVNKEVVNQEKETPKLPD